MSIKQSRFFWPVLLGLCLSASLTLCLAKMLPTAAAVVGRQANKKSTSWDSLAPPLSSGAPVTVKVIEQPANLQTQGDDQPIEVEPITVQANGFEPREITRLSGRFMLAISNRSGTAELALHLDRFQGSRVHEVGLPQGRVRWNKVLDLPPGDYVLSEQNHPDWICRIKLTAR
jgi:hypothetical protein